MRVKRDRRRDRLSRKCPIDNRAHYLLMPEVEPIKNAKRENGWFLYVGVLCAVKDLHRYDVDNINLSKPLVGKIGSMSGPTLNMLQFRRSQQETV
jgi:hypothetical protein